MGVTEDAAAVVATGTAINENVNDYFQQLLDRGNAGIVAIEEEYQARIDSMKTVSFINQMIGDDAADGSTAAPFKTVQAALDKTPRGGICFANVTDNFFVDDDIDIDQKLLVMASSSSIRHKIDFECGLDSSRITDSRFFKSFSLNNGGAVHLSNLNIVMPEIGIKWANIAPSAWNAMFKPTWSRTILGDMSVAISYCDLTFPDDNFAPLFPNIPTNLYCTNNTIKAAPILGKIMSGVSDPDGTDPATISAMHTNLTAI